jgi:hypothetical protein
VIVLGKLTEKQESRILEEIISKMGAKEGNGRIKQRRRKEHLSKDYETN